MADEILAVGTTAVDSSDVVVAESTQLAVCLKDVAGPAIPNGVLVYISLKDDAGQYFRIEQLRTSQPIAVLNAGTYRISRIASAVACGVFSQLVGSIGGAGGGGGGDGAITAPLDGNGNVKTAAFDSSGATVQYPNTSLDLTNARIGAEDAAAVIDPASANAPTNSLLKGLLTFAVGIAHDAADSLNPTKIGGRAVAALSALTLVASGDRTSASFDLDGALIVRTGGSIGDRISNTASNTDGTSTACIAAQAAGIKVNLTDVTIANTSASNIIVEIKDGTTTKWIFPVPAGGGVTHRFETPLTGTAATAWNFDPSAATTTVYCSMAGRLSKV